MRTTTRRRLTVFTKAAGAVTAGIGLMTIAFVALDTVFETLKPMTGTAAAMVIAITVVFAPLAGIVMVIADELDQRRGGE